MVRTYTVTATSVGTVLTTDYALETDTIDITSTVVVDETVTVTSPTTTIIVVSTSSIEVDPTTFVEKRDAPVATIPTYASACSGEVRYTSACACIGVRQQTVTAPTPSTTVTVVGATQIVTEVVTVSETATATIEATATETVIGATQTVGGAATVTVLSKFKIKVSGVSDWLYVYSDGSVDTDESYSEATEFTLVDGVLWTADMQKFAYVLSNSYNSVRAVMVGNDLPILGDLASVSVGADGQITIGFESYQTQCLESEVGLCVVQSTADFDGQEYTVSLVMVP